MIIRWPTHSSDDKLGKFILHLGKHGNFMMTAASIHIAWQVDTGQNLSNG